MEAVESQDCSWEASGCMRRSFLVCFWYDLSAAWKMAWKRDSEEDAVVDGVDDMTRSWEYRGGGLRGMIDRGLSLGRGQTPPHGRGSYHHPKTVVSAYNDRRACPRAKLPGLRRSEARA